MLPMIDQSKFIKFATLVAPNQISNKYYHNRVVTWEGGSWFQKCFFTPFQILLLTMSTMSLNIEIRDSQGKNDMPTGFCFGH